LDRRFLARSIGALIDQIDPRRAGALTRIADCPSASLIDRHRHDLPDFPATGIMHGNRNNRVLPDTIYWFLLG
jgi:hypothetical protein